MKSQTWEETGCSLHPARVVQWQSEHPRWHITRNSGKSGSKGRLCVWRRILNGTGRATVKWSERGRFNEWVLSKKSNEHHDLTWLAGYPSDWPSRVLEMDLRKEMKTQQGQARWIDRANDKRNCQFHPMPPFLFFVSFVNPLGNVTKIYEDQRTKARITNYRLMTKKNKKNKRD